MTHDTAKTSRLHIMVTPEMKADIDRVRRLDPNARAEADVVRMALDRYLPARLEELEPKPRTRSAPVDDRPPGPRIFATPVSVSREDLQPQRDIRAEIYAAQQDAMRRMGLERCPTCASADRDTRGVLFMQMDWPNTPESRYCEDAWHTAEIPAFDPMPARDIDAEIRQGQQATAAASRLGDRREENLRQAEDAIGAFGTVPRVAGPHLGVE